MAALITDVDEQLSRSLLAAASIIAIITWVVGTRCFRSTKVNTSKRTQLPPGPRGLPLVGYMPYLKLSGKPIHRTFADLAVEYGPIFKFWVGNHLYVGVSSPGLAREVLRDKESIFSTREVPLAIKVCSYGGLDLGCLPVGPDWNWMRKGLTRHALSNASLDHCYPPRRRAVVAALKKLHGHGGHPAAAVRVFDVVFETVVSATVGMLWGGVNGNFAGEVRKVGQGMVKLMGRPNVSDVFPVLARFDLQGIRRESEEASDRLDGILTAVIRKRQLEGEKGKTTSSEVNKVKDWLQTLLESYDGSSLTSITHFKALLQDIVVGAPENIASTIEWAMAELLKSETAMRELDEIVGTHSLVEDDHLSDLNYLDAVIKETCRLHLSFFQRVATQPCSVGGYAIPQGTKLFVNAWAIHRDPAFWDEPLEFRPERFLERENNGRRFDFMGTSSGFDYLPFGSGRRVCPGINLAERLMKYVLASLLHSFEWKLPDGEDPAEIDLSDAFSIHIKKKKPLIAVPTVSRLSSPDLLFAELVI